MPFGGKPSKGCQNCRQRKIACDQLPDGCTQCARTKRTCPGYRDHVSMLFRNESEEVAQRAQAKWRTRSFKSNQVLKESPPVANITTSPQDSALPTPQLDMASLVIPTSREEMRRLAPSPMQAYSFPIPVDERATSFFYANYVAAGDRSQTQIPEHLLASMKAVGLAAFAGRENSAQYQREAAKKYTEAVRLLNAALKSPIYVKSDSTLQAVLTLGMFESVTGGNKQSLEAWVNHMNGAASLIKLRGREQLLRPVGRRLFFQSFNNLLMACSTQETAIPRQIVELREELGKHLDNPNFLPWLFQEEFAKFTIFRCEVKAGVYKDRRLLLEGALRIDRALESIFAAAEPSWQYATIFTRADHDFVFYDYYHHYPNLSVAQIWNGMRLVRMILHQLICTVWTAILATCPPDFVAAEGRAQRSTSIAILLQMKKDIIASVPQHMGFSSKNGSFFHTSGTGNYRQSVPDPPVASLRWADMPDLQSKMPFNNGHKSDVPLISGSGGYYLMWPLYVAAYIPAVATDASRRYVVRLFRSIARSMGIMQALILADSLEQKEHVAVLTSR